MSIEIRNVSKHFGQVRALNRLNLKVEDGELLALLGPSGSGKSTLLRIIAGLECADPVPGDNGPRILFNNQAVDQRSLRHRGVGFVFQHYSLFKHLSVFENIAFGLRVRPRKSRPDRETIRKRVVDLLHLVQLESLARRYPHQLSGGQRQRVALARALAVEPAVLLLDEPFGALDAKVRTELRTWLRRLHDEIHITSVFVTHDQEEALEVADRVVIMNQGSIEQIGTPYEVFHEPRTAFVMDFIGASNRFSGWLDKPASSATRLPKDRDEEPETEYYVRPHEIVIRETSAWRLLPWKNLVQATIKSVRTAGTSVKIELEDQYGRPVSVDMPHKAFNAKRIKSGRKVLLEFKRYRQFPDLGGKRS
jgi:sulfate transport system ATP-binding protein